MDIKDFAGDFINVKATSEGGIKAEICVSDDDVADALLAAAIMAFAQKCKADPVNIADNIADVIDAYRREFGDV